MTRPFFKGDFTTALEALMNDSEFRYWSDRSLQETIAAINADCPRMRAGHERLAHMCVCQALASIPPESIGAWVREAMSAW